MRLSVHQSESHTVWGNWSWCGIISFLAKIGAFKPTSSTRPNQQRTRLDLPSPKRNQAHTIRRLVRFKYETCRLTLYFPNLPPVPPSSFTKPTLEMDTTKQFNSIKISERAISFSPAMNSGHSPDSDMAVLSANRRGSSSTYASVESFDESVDLSDTYAISPSTKRQTDSQPVRKRVPNACDFCRMKKAKVLIAVS